MDFDHNKNGEIENKRVSSLSTLQGEKDKIAHCHGPNSPCVWTHMHMVFLNNNHNDNIQ